MKTVNCTLPIYNSLARQTFERANVIKVGHDKPVPVLCPRHRLPSFQWNAEDDASGAPVKIELLNKDYDGTEQNIGTDWSSHTGFDPAGFTHAGLEITLAQNGAGICVAGSNIFDTILGTQIRIIGTLVRNSAPGTEPTIFIDSHQIENLAVGLNNIVLTAFSGIPLGQINIYRNGATDYTFQTVSITKILNTIDITDYFVSLPAPTVLATDTYYSYNGDELNFLLPEGEYYLRITTANGFIYYSDWFKVDCIYTNLISAWTNINYDAGFASTGTLISHAHETGADGNCKSDLFELENEEVITVIFFLTLTSDQLPSLGLFDESGNLIETQSVIAGLNVLTLTSDYGGLYFLQFSNSAACVWSTLEIIAIREYSPKYLTIDFANTCDLGDILYQSGFVQTLWLESETMEPSFPQEEEGQKNGEGRLIRTFRRQVKKYTARTKEIPDFIVEVLHRMKLHDAIQLTDLTGNVNDVYNLEVDHEWLYDDKYYAKADLVFDYDEVFVVSACCEDLT